ncbi:hypothetical protein ACNHKD_14775 [Methylocystis sp. JAN1]|uniref:hypothetical protein n=1 Tax=Methylocystis sp. JAN1 TaxID=3397211 RepID=UPI003FA3256D
MIRIFSPAQVATRRSAPGARSRNWREPEATLARAMASGLAHAPKTSLCGR